MIEGSIVEILLGTKADLAPKRGRSSLASDTETNENSSEQQVSELFKQEFPSFLQQPVVLSIFEDVKGQSLAKCHGSERNIN